MSQNLGHHKQADFNRLFSGLLMVHFPKDGFILKLWPKKEFEEGLEIKKNKIKIL